MIAALAGFLIYTWLLFLTEPTLQFIVIKLTVYLGIVIVLAIIGLYRLYFSNNTTSHTPRRTRKSTKE